MSALASAVLFGAAAAAALWRARQRRKSYKRRSFDVVFFDCDDCLYQNDWEVANIITANIEGFCTSKVSSASLIQTSFNPPSNV